jgi:hypothetical protein
VNHDQYPWENWHVRLDLEGEVIFWRNKLRCSDEELFNAVQARGSLAKDVAAYLDEQGHRSEPAMPSMKVPESAWSRRI